MIDMRDVLAAIDAYQEKHPDKKDAVLSRAATGSPDTIRNWRRAVREGKDAGAHVKKLQAVGRVIGVDFAIEGIQPLLRSEDEVRGALERIIGLTDNDVEFITRQIKSAQISNDGEQLSPQPHDQSESSNRRHERAP